MSRVLRWLLVEVGWLERYRLCCITLHFTVWDDQLDTMPDDGPGLRGAVWLQHLERAHIGKGPENWQRVSQHISWRGQHEHSYPAHPSRAYKYNYDMMTVV